MYIQNKTKHKFCHQDTRQTLAQSEACSFPTDTTLFLKASTFPKTCYIVNIHSQQNHDIIQCDKNV